MKRLLNATEPRLSSRAGRTLLACGFSLVEVLVAAVLGGVIITTVARMSDLSNMAIFQSSDVETVQADINRDIETIRDRMTAYTWCSGAGSITPCSTSTSLSKKSELYYKPVSDSQIANAGNGGDSTTTQDPNSPTALFKNACNDKQSTPNNLLLANLINLIDQLPALPNGISRSVAVQDGASKLIRITYTTPANPNAVTKQIQRSVLMSPTVAAWCP